MPAVVVVAEDVDERDVWPYAVWSDSDGMSTTLTLRVHDSQELVGVLAALTAQGLEVTSARLIETTGGWDPAAGPADPDLDCSGAARPRAGAQGAIELGHDGGAY